MKQVANGYKTVQHLRAIYLPACIALCSRSTVGCEPSVSGKDKAESVMSKGAVAIEPKSDSGCLTSETARLQRSASRDD